ncbi:MAG TPA: AI-2E family transporter [Myxococcota bacterium]|nr:AI-2E family transporter [Myxococcota bacterium]
MARDTGSPLSLPPEPGHPLGVSTDRSHSTPSSTTNALLGLASVVVIVAGMKAASSLFVPFLLAAFISLLCAPALFWLRDRGLPTPIALVVVLLGLLGIGAALGGLLGTSINEFTRLLPAYQARFGAVVESVATTLVDWGIDLGPSTEEANPFDPQAALGLVGNLAGNLGTLLNNAFLLFLTVCFILLEASSFPWKVREAFGESDEVDDRMNEIGDSIRRYLGIKTLTSMATGFLAYGLLILLGVKFAPLWGLIAFLLNFVPAIGSVIAAVPAVALALVDNGAETAAIVALGYILINISIGNFLEPRVMGEGMGLSPLVVLVSLIFWGWVLGSVGMVLAVPLTVILRIMLDSQPSTQWLAVLLGPAFPNPVAPRASPATQDESPQSEPT